MKASSNTSLFFLSSSLIMTQKFFESFQVSFIFELSQLLFLSPVIRAVIVLCLIYLSLYISRISLDSPLALAILHSLFRKVLNLMFSISSSSTQGAEIIFTWFLPASFTIFLLLRVSSIDDFKAQIFLPTH